MRVAATSLANGWIRFCGISALLAVGCALHTEAGGAGSAGTADDPPVVNSMKDPAPTNLGVLKAELPALPSSWKLQRIKKTGTHVEAEWHSPTERTLVGVVYIHVPPFMPKGALVKSVKEHYVKDQPGGKITKQWADSAGRNWFEVEGSVSYCKGYVVARTGKAWFAYYQYLKDQPKESEEISQAEKMIEEVRPMD